MKSLKYDIDTAQARAAVHHSAYRSAGVPAEREPKAKPKFVDFAAVPPSQYKVHDRLLNWARSLNSRTRQEVSVGFDLYRSSDARREYGADTSVPVNTEDAAKIAAAVAILPIRLRQAIQWLYTNGRDPLGNAVKLGTARQGLLELINEGRAKLIEQGA